MRHPMVIKDFSIVIFKRHIVAACVPFYSLLCNTPNYHYTARTRILLLAGNVVTFFALTASPVQPIKTRNIKKITHLQWTLMGPSWPNCSFVLCTCPMKSINPSPDFGTPCSGQSVNWNCLTVRDWPSCFTR